MADVNGTNMADVFRYARSQKMRGSHLGFALNLPYDLNKSLTFSLTQFLNLLSESCICSTLCQDILITDWINDCESIMKDAVQMWALV